MDLDTVVDTRRTLSNLGAIKFKVDRDRPELSLMDTLKCAFGHAIQYTFFPSNSNAMLRLLEK